MPGGPLPRPRDLDVLLGPYRLLDVLGEGAMGTVYRAEPQDGAPAGLPSVVAVKLLHLEAPTFGREAAAPVAEDRRRRFEREARIGRTVRDARVMRVFDGFEVVHEGRRRWALVLEHVPGTPLSEPLAAEGRLPEALALHVAAEVCRGLAALHAEGVVHRDLKPSNVMLTPDERVVIVDLGVARLSDASDALTGTGEFVGTVRYAAPEQFEGRDRVGPAADLFSLGVVLYEALAGAPPFPAPDLGALLRRLAMGRPTPLGSSVPGLAPWVEALVDQLLDRDPDARPRSALEVLEALRHGRASRWWRTVGRERLRRPARLRLRVDRATAFTGRATERARLRAQLEAAGRGRGRLVFLRGPEGAGASRLLDQALVDATEALAGAGVACGGTLGGGADLVAAVADLRRDLGGGADAEPTEVAVRATHAALAAELRAAARERPWLVALDGVETALPGAVDLLVALAHAVRDRPVLLLATLASGTAGDRALAAIPSDVPFEVVELGPLPPSDLEALLAARLGSAALARDLLAPLDGAIDGLPGEALLLVDGLERSGAFATSPDGTVTRRDRPLLESAVRLPHAAEEQLRRRLDALPAADRELLDAAAVLGPSVEPALVAAILGLQPLRVVRDLARLARATGCLRGAGRRFVFVSAGTLQGVRRDVPEPLVRALHAGALRALATDEALAGGEDLELLRARHALGAGDREALTASLPAALGRLETAGALVAAAELLRRALDEPDLLDRDARLEALLRLSDPARYRAGFVDFDARLAEAHALSEGRPAARAVVLQRQAVLALERGDLAEATARLDDAERAAAAGDAAAGPLLPALGRLRARIARSAGRHDEALRLLEAHLARLRAAGAPVVEQALTLYAIGVAVRGGAAPQDARGPLEEALRLAREAGNVPLEVDALNSLAFFPFREGDTAAARVLQQQALHLAVRTGRRTTEALVRGNLGRTRMQAGDLEGALEEALRAEEPDAHARRRAGPAGRPPAGGAAPGPARGAGPGTRGPARVARARRPGDARRGPQFRAPDGREPRVGLRRRGRGLRRVRSRPRVPRRARPRERLPVGAPPARAGPRRRGAARSRRRPTPWRPSGSRCR